MILAANKSIFMLHIVIWTLIPVYSFMIAIRSNDLSDYQYVGVEPRLFQDEKGGIHHHGCT